MRQPGRGKRRAVPERIYGPLRVTEEFGPSGGFPFRGRQRRHDAVGQEQAVIFQQPEVRTPSFDQMKIGDRPDEGIRVQDERAVFAGDVEHRLRLFLREPVMRPVVDPSVPDAQRRHRQRADGVDRRRRLRFPVPQTPCQRVYAVAQPEREDAVGDQRIRAEGRDPQRFVVESEHGDEQEAAGREPQGLA